MSGTAKKMTAEELQIFIAETVKAVVGTSVDDMRKENQNFFANFSGNGLPKDETTKDKGISIGKLIRTLAAGRGDPYRAEQIANKWFGADNGISKALAAGDATAGGFLVGEEMSSEVIELLYPQTVVRGSNPVMMPMTRGNLTLPKLNGGASSNYISENQNITPSEQNFATVQLVFKKLVTLVPVSNDLLRHASYNADAIVRDDLIQSMAVREDLAFLRGDGLNDTPLGIRNWAIAPNLITANATVNLDNVTSDLGDAVLALEEADVRMIRPVWFMSPKTKQYLMTVRDGNGNYAFRDEMLRGTLWGFMFKSTTQIPSNLGGGSNESEVYLVDMADAVIGESTTMTIDASSEAAYYDGSQVQSSFSRDQTVIRAIAEHDFVMRHDLSIAIITEVKWGN